MGRSFISLLRIAALMTVLFIAAAGSRISARAMTSAPPTDIHAHTAAISAAAVLQTVVSAPQPQALATPTPAPCTTACITGLWHQDYTGGAIDAYCSSAYSGHLDGSFTGTASCTDAAQPGTITEATFDPVTRQFSLTEAFPIGTDDSVVTDDWVVTANGEIAPDGSTMTGTWSCLAGCSGTGTFTGFNVIDTVGAQIPAAQGGTLATSVGDTLTVPPAALPQDAIVTIDLVPLPLPAPAGESPIRTAFTFGPAGTVFNSPVTVVFPYTLGDLPAGADPSTLRVALFDPPSSSWIFQGGTVDTVSQTVTIDLAHFSTYALFLTSPPAPTSTPTATPTTTATPTAMGANHAVGGITNVRMGGSAVPPTNTGAVRSLVASAIAASGLVLLTAAFLYRRRHRAL